MIPKVNNSIQLKHEFKNLKENTIGVGILYILMWIDWKYQQRQQTKKNSEEHSSTVKHLAAIVATKYLIKRNLNAIENGAGRLNPRKDTKERHIQGVELAIKLT